MGTWSDRGASPPVIPLSPLTASLLSALASFLCCSSARAKARLKINEIKRSNKPRDVLLISRGSAVRFV